jgi:hypothetical protein
MGNEHTSTVLLEWKRSRGEVARLVLQEFSGQDLLHLRVFYTDEKGELKPTRQGLILPHVQLKSLRKALRKVEEILNAKAAPEAQPVEVNKDPKRKKKSSWGASSKSERPPWE